MSKFSTILRGLLFTVLGSALIVEVGLRVLPLEAIAQFKHSVDPVGTEMQHSNIEPHPYLAYAGKPDWVRPSALHGDQTASHDSRGFKGPERDWVKSPATFRIACLGGSSTYGHGPSSNATTWPARLEHYLSESYPERSIEVLNAGMRGYSTFESLINYALRVADFDPDLVIVYHTINDMRCALYPGVVRDNQHFRAVWRSYVPSPLERWFGWSWTYRIARRYGTDYLAERGNLGSYVIRGFRPNRDVYNPNELPPRGLANFERNLRDIATLARGDGASVAFVTQAMDHGDMAGIYSSRRNQSQAILAFTESVRSSARTEDVLLIDAAPILEAAAQAQRDSGGPDANDTIFTQEVHLTDEGADLLARTIADGLIKAGAIQ